MKDPLSLVIFILAMAGATALTRFLPFFLPARWIEHRLVQIVQTSLPAVILLLLVIYSLKDTPVTQPPYGIPEAIALAVVLGLHFWKRNPLLSIAGGTALYMLLVQTRPF